MLRSATTPRRSGSSAPSFPSASSDTTRRVASSRFRRSRTAESLVGGPFGPLEAGARGAQAELERDSVRPRLRVVRILLRRDLLELRQRRPRALRLAAEVRLGLFRLEQPEEEE